MNKTELEREIEELENENEELRLKLRDAKEHCVNVNTENDELKRDMMKIKSASKQLQDDLLLYIQLNGELARENLRLQEKLKEYETEATA